MSRETESIIAALVASGIEHAVTDINTDGVHSASGNHYKRDCEPLLPCHRMDVKSGKEGRAVDFAHSRGDGKRDTPELLAIYRFFADNFGKKNLLNELYYSGPGADHCVRSGKFMLWDDVPKAARDKIRKTHHDHIHVAVARGVFLTPVAKPDEEDDMPKPDTPVDACLAPGGGVWTLTYDGGVRATGGAPFFGSYPGLPASKKKGKRNFVAIEPFGDGYTIISDDENASSYHFNAQVFADLQKRTRGRNR